MNELLVLAQKITLNNGLAIILLTIGLRLILSPLQYLSLKSMKKMKEIQPQLASIKEKHSDDPIKARNETLKIFKEKSLNPLISLLPIFVQMPLFISFYKFLSHSPHIIGATFGGWLIDLSLPDPWLILPVLAGGLQLITMLNGEKKSSDTKTNNWFKYVMSAVFTIVMLKLPAAILLYTVTSSISTLIEKSLINRML